MANSKPIALFSASSHGEDFDRDVSGTSSTREVPGTSASSLPSHFIKPASFAQVMQSREELVNLERRVLVLEEKMAPLIHLEGRVSRLEAKFRTLNGSDSTDVFPPPPPVRDPEQFFRKVPTLRLQLQVRFLRQKIRQLTSEVEQLKEQRYKQRRHGEFIRRMLKITRRLPRRLSNECFLDCDGLSASPSTDSDMD